MKDVFIETWETLIDYPKRINLNVNAYHEPSGIKVSKENDVPYCSYSLNNLEKINDMKINLKSDALKEIERLIKESQWEKK